MNFHPAPPTHSFHPGQVLFHEGDISRSIYLIRKGTVSIRKTKGGAQVEIARIYSNEVIGELSFFDRQPRSAAAVALTEVEVQEISFDSLDKIFSQVPEYMRTIIACMAERLRKADDVIRRLQKDVVQDQGGEAHPADGTSASDVLAATANPAPEQRKSARKEEESEKSSTSKK